MKRLLEILFPKPHDKALIQRVKQTNISLEQLQRDHRRATQRADKAMDDSVKIAQDALRKREGG